MRALRIGISVAVVAVAAAVAYASLSKEKDAAQRAGSLRNLQQWGIALNLYLTDNDNQLPEVGKAPVAEDQRAAWFNALPPYISQKPLAALPPGERPRPGVPSLWMNPLLPEARHWDPAEFFFAYAMNRALQPDPAARSFRIYEIPHPGNIVFLAETDGFEPGCGPETIASWEGAKRSKKPAALTGVLFCDGHAQAVPRTQLEAPAARTAEAAENGVSWFME